MAATVLPNSFGNSQKTFYETFGTGLGSTGVTVSVIPSDTAILDAFLDTFAKYSNVSVSPDTQIGNRYDTLEGQAAFWEVQTPALRNDNILGNTYC